MNPKRWRWYTWLALVYFVIVLVANFDGTIPTSLISVLVGLEVWFVLWLIHEVIRAFYLAFTGKTPPPVTKPPQGQG